MGITARVWAVEHVEDDDDLVALRSARIAPGTHELDLDQTLPMLADILESVGIDDMLESTLLERDEVARVARRLKSLPWERARKMVEEEHWDYVEYYFVELRELFMNASRDGHGIAIDVV